MDINDIKIKKILQTGFMVFVPISGNDEEYEKIHNMITHLFLRKMPELSRSVELIEDDWMFLHFQLRAYGEMEQEQFQDAIAWLLHTAASLGARLKEVL